MIKAGLFAVTLGCASAYAQGATTLTAQQAAEPTAQSCPQSSQVEQKAHRVKLTDRPTFSIESGQVTAGTTVTIRSSTPNAAIYYTTEPWIPTMESTRYTGPIFINETTHLRAIAVAPKMGWSLIAPATYTVDGPAIPKPDEVLITDGVLHSGTPLRLVTNSDISSKIAQAGEKISVLLDEDLKANGVVLAPKGTPVDATIADASKAGRYGMFGMLGFQVHSVTVRGTTIPLRGVGVVWGSFSMREMIVGSTPFVNLASGRVYGNEARIRPGMELTAHVARDTPLMF
jgi:hypothetical protein